MTGRRVIRALLPDRVAIPVEAGYEAARRRISAARRVSEAASHGNPILIYQMGKVGSKTVYRSLLAAEIGVPIFHLHNMARLDQVRLEYKRAGIVPIPEHLHHAQRLLRLIRRGDIRPQIITGVRDPVAREVSAALQHPMISGARMSNKEAFTGETPHFAGLQSQMRLWRSNVEVDSTVSYLSGRLSQPDTFEYTFGWFNREIKDVFDVDVLEHPFDHSRGWTAIESEHADILVFTVEKLSGLLKTVLSEFVGAPEPLTEVRSNVRAHGVAGDAYADIARLTKLDPSVCERIYSSRFVRHFYDEESIDAMIGRWSRETPYDEPETSSSD